MQQLEIRLLGGFEVTLGNHPITTVEGRKSQELLSYLLVARGQAKSRELAVDAVWPDASPGSGRKQIRQALWNIHDALDETECAQRLVLAKRDHLAVNPDRGRWCDAVDFARAVERSHVADRVDDLELERALGLYRGSFLDGCYSEWCLIERERLEGIYLLALDVASERAELRGDHWIATKWGLALLHIDCAHERTHQRLMSLYHAAGDRTRALQQFERCCAALKTELGVDPSRKTMTLLSAIRDDLDISSDCHHNGRTLNDQSSASGSSPEEAASSDELRSTLLSEIASLRRSIDGLQRAIENLS